MVLSLFAVLLIIRWIGRGVNNRVPDGGVNVSMYVDVNGSRQWIHIYGQDRNNPVLLYLHGGPGSATSLFDYAFTRKWSDVYTVVTWDQRGCGKSFDKSHPETITADIMMSDGKVMTEYLRDFLQVDQITLLGHSWGSYLGANLALAYPEYYEAFIGTGSSSTLTKTSAGSTKPRWSGRNTTRKAVRWSISGLGAGNRERMISC